MFQKIAVFLLLLHSFPGLLVSAKRCDITTCLNGGECEDSYEKNFICHCTKDFKGDRCQYLMQPGDNICLTNPCFAGGICKPIDKGFELDYMCKCSVGLGGKNCKYLKSYPCKPYNPCQNGGNCDMIDYNGRIESICYCKIGFTGRLCETKLACDHDLYPCYNNGHCDNNKCRCGFNYHGERCEIYRPPKADRKVVIINKGAYTANMRLTYNQPVGDYNVELISQYGSIVAGQSYIFLYPYNVDLYSPTGVWLDVQAVSGNAVIKEGLQMEEQCFHIWGTTLDARYTRIDWDKCFYPYN